ncbi:MULTISPECIES: hypothetical protein [unclassified Devosia]|uniref:hypothetical protein n=1 Tax=unclassified Devosia TaxID=196773 RepID=UPI0015582335|nr:MULTISPECIES: hypothetical protein [unclassified Devosia]
MRKKPLVIGWTLVPSERMALLTRFVPVYPDVVAHHVTLRFGAPAWAALPAERAGDIIGRVDDGVGLEALVLRIGGTSDRPGGGTYHITWSLDRGAGRKPVDSNEVLARLGWTDIEPVCVRLLPGRF